MDAPVDPTDAGYDEATRTADGRDEIPAAVTERVPVRPPGTAPEGTDGDTDDVLDDTHDVDELADALRPGPASHRELNTRDNQARWSSDPGT